MSLLSIAAEKREYVSGLARPEPWLIETLGGRRSKTGVNVNEQTAMRFSAVSGCIRILAETLACLPLGLFRKRKDGGADKADGEPLYDILHNAPNLEMPSYNFREAMMANILAGGNSYAPIQRNGAGEVIALWPKLWHEVWPERDPETQRIVYKVNDRGKTETLPFEKVFHVPGLGFNGIKGFSPIRMAMESVGLGLAAEEFAALFYANGANVGGILTVPGLKNKDTRDAIKKEFEERAGGLGKSHGVMVLENDIQYHRVGIPLTEAQFIETRKFQIEEIARIYRVPLHLLQSLDRATFNNIEHQSLEFVKYTMLPWFARWEQAINFRLLTPRQREQGYFAKFNAEGLLRGDTKSRYEAYHYARQDGWMNTDEIRAKEDLNPLPNGEGQDYWQPLNMVDTDTVAKIKKQKGGEEKDG